MSDQWITLGDQPTWDESHRIDVVPIGDLIEHDTVTDECVCVPRVEFIKGNDGSDNWQHVHHSLDGRELTE